MTCTTAGSDYPTAVDKRELPEASGSPDWVARLVVGWFAPPSEPKGSISWSRTSMNDYPTAVDGRAGIGVRHRAFRGTYLRSPVLVRVSYFKKNVRTKMEKVYSYMTPFVASIMERSVFWLVLKMESSSLKLVRYTNRLEVNRAMRDYKAGKISLKQANEKIQKSNEKADRKILDCLESNTKNLDAIQKSKIAFDEAYKNFH